MVSETMNFAINIAMFICPSERIPGGCPRYVRVWSVPPEWCLMSTSYHGSENLEVWYHIARFVLNSVHPGNFLKRLDVANSTKMIFNIDWLSWFQNPWSLKPILCFVCFRTVGTRKVTRGISGTGPGVASYSVMMSNVGFLSWFRKRWSLILILICSVCFRYCPPQRFPGGCPEMVKYIIVLTESST